MKPFENCLFGKDSDVNSIEIKLRKNGVSERFSDFCDAPITELISKYLLN